MKTDKNIKNTNLIEGRNPVLEAFKAGRTVDKLFVSAGRKSGIMLSIIGEAKKQGTTIREVSAEKIAGMSKTRAHQGVIASVSDYAFCDVEDIVKKAKDSGNPAFILLLDRIEDPRNLGAILRTANLAGAHGVIITKHKSSAITPSAVKASAGAVNYIPVARVSSLASAIEELKKEGLWFVCADMDGEPMYDFDFTVPIGLVMGNEGGGVSRLVKEKCDMKASIPMMGNIDSLNVSAAAAVLSYEIVRQRIGRN